MTRYENQCVDCGFPCRYEACRNYRVRVLKCDNCHDEVEKPYRLDGEESCSQCALVRLEVVE